MRCFVEAKGATVIVDGVGLGDVPRGVYKGTVFVRWLTNRLLLVGAYSPFIKEPRPTAWLARSQQGSRMTLSGKAQQLGHIQVTLSSCLTCRLCCYWSTRQPRCIKLHLQPTLLTLHSLA